MTTIDRAQSAPVATQHRMAVYEFGRAQTKVVYPAPVFGSWSPAAGAVARLASIQVTVTDPTGFDSLLIWAERPDGTGVLVYDGSFTPDFDAGSSVSGTTTLTITIVHDAPGWTTDYTLYARAESAQGVTAQSSSAYTLADPPPPPVVDTTPPTVTLVSPPAGSLIVPGAVIVIEVTDANGFAAIIAWAVYGGTAFPAEVVHDGEAFLSGFAASSRVAIAGGWRYTLRRSAGWPSGRVDIKFRPVDSLGNTP